MGKNHKRDLKDPEENNNKTKQTKWAVTDTVLREKSVSMALNTHLIDIFEQ